MVLVTGETDDDYLVLTDIQGLRGFLRRYGLQSNRNNRGYHSNPDGYQDPRTDKTDRRRGNPQEPERQDSSLWIVMKGAIAEPRKEVGEYAPKIIRSRSIRQRSVM